MTKLGIIVNPMSGRDVRRVAAKASTSTHQDKQQHVTRLVLGALAQGVEQIYLGNEPFRINERATENLPEKDKITILEYQLSHTEQDTVTMVNMMWDAGCRVFIVLGGDGTSRIVAKTKPDAIILPLSTGTNNVFPTFVEASVAGAAAGLISSGRLDYKTACYRCKQVHVEVLHKATATLQKDVALVDAILIKNDQMGNLMPFKPENLLEVILARAEPASVGISPIGGYLEPCGAEDDFGVHIQCNDSEQAIKHTVSVPLSPGLYGDIPVNHFKKIELDEKVTCHAAGILAFDGDRTILVSKGDELSFNVSRSGPWIIDAKRVLAAAVAQKLLIH